MADNFRAHDRKGGPRLEAQQALGRRGGIRFIDDEERPAATVVRKDGGSALKALQGLVDGALSERGASSGVRRSGPKGGRPGLGRPWDAAGISRAEYFRRRKREAGDAGE